MYYAVPEGDLDSAPECFWPKKDFFNNLYIEDIPPGYSVSVQLSKGYPEFDFGEFRDARIYRLNSELGIIVRHFYEDFSGVLNQHSLVNIIESLILDAGHQHIQLTYKDEDAELGEEYIEYFVKAELSETLSEAIDSVRSLILTIENSFLDKVCAVSNLYHQIVDSGGLVNPNRCDEVSRAESNSDKGRILEKLMEDCFYSIGGLRFLERNLNTATQEIDLIFENLSNSSSWSRGSRVVLVECKNWSTKVGRSEFDAFENKIKDRGGACKVGFFVAWSGVTRDFELERLRASREDYLIIVLDRKGIQEALTRGSFREYVEESYKEALKV